MTFDDDFIQFQTEAGPKRFTLKSLRLDWPPPDRVALFGFIYQQVRRSEITDEVRATMTHVARGAEYRYVNTERVSS